MKISKTDLDCLTIITENTDKTKKVLDYIAKRLYSENKLNGDEMRDMAQSLQYLIDLIWSKKDCED